MEAYVSKTRREFLGQTLAAGGAVVATASLGLSCGSKETADPPASSPTTAKKRILILGGTGFLGPKTVEAALARGHEVTIFNRGKREKVLPFPYQNVEHLYGNRDPLLPADDERGKDGKLLHPDATPKGLEQLAGKSWDAVIDNSGYFPRIVKASAELLAPNAKQYIFISSISAYAENKAVGADERQRSRPSPIRPSRPWASASRTTARSRRCASRPPRLHSQVAPRSCGPATSSGPATRPTASRTGPCARRAAARSSHPGRPKIRPSGSTCATWPSGS
jgi:hypothetical protein